ncbi:TRAP transporter large permease [Ohessyouella blattaphilus]|uniref:TRAP transporter large permease n=1 Tax=Ohessyouella blattaphilus TaxID=2949333 RepID=A0ABT1EHI6_9FIRM|nr:TRAP transporter large permease [Ohessyouella blattaphilus]MCP1110160.1 TRAP transporter large permease [Ohessyouella blattaphilus]MCR8563554.1 TRAP transporter large permease [Ohessyouella blattaphilus]
MIIIAVVALLILLVIGVPVCFAIGLSGLLAIMLGSDVPTFMAVQQSVRGMNSFSLMAGPLFILAGEILGGAQLSKRILDFCRACISQLKGGMGMVSVLANMIFAGISGSGAATMSAVGSLTVPELKKVGYERSFIAALIAGSGSLGPIIPPSTNMIVFASLTGFSVGKLFLGGVVPGILIGVCLMVMCYLYARKHNVDNGTGTFSFKAVLKAFKEAFFALITPLIIIGGVISGVFTATEAGIVACLYGLICGFFIYKTLKLRDLVEIFKRAASSSAMLMMLMGISSIYSYIFARENLAVKIQEFMLSVSTNPTVVVQIIIVIMLVIGCFMETLAATAVILPIVYPIIIALGVDPLVFGVLFSVATVVGGLTPPVGLYLFISMNIAEANFKEAIKYTAPVVLIVLAVMILIWFFPSLVTVVPNLIM